MISTLTSPSFVNRVQESWQAGYGVTQSSPVSGNPFTQAGFTLDMNFAAVPQQNLIWVTDEGLRVKTFSEIVTFTRASTGSYFNSAGVLQKATYNILPYSEQFDNAAWGKVGMTVTANAATAPDNTVTGDKLIPSVVTGLPYTQQTITVVSGANYAWSVYLKAAGYSWVFLDAYDGANHRTWFDLSTGTIGTVEAGNTATITDVGNGWYRCTIARSSGSVSTAYAVAIVSGNNELNITGNGVSGVFAWGAQLEQASAPGPYYATTTTANGAPRFDYNPSTLAPLGLLIEEQRTNSIRNNTMQGAVAGTPGTLPTNWQTLGAGLGTLTRTIVGTGTSAGINYIDVRINGTTSTTSFGIGFETFTQIAAAVGQTWTSSVYLSRVGGTTANLTVNLRINDRDSGGGSLANTDIDITSTLGTTLSRFSQTRTLAGVGTAAVSNDVLFIFSSGVAIDITLRIGLPQLEQGAFVTSVIPTTTAAATRTADVAPVNTLSPWYNQTEGTIVVEAANAQAAPALFSTDDGTTSNRVITYFNAANSPAFQVVSGGVNQANFAAGSIAQNATFRLAAAYQLNNFAASLNGAATVTDTSGTVPTGQTTARLGANVSGATVINGYIRRITYYPRRLSNNELQAITT